MTLLTYDIVEGNPDKHEQVKLTLRSSRFNYFETYKKTKEVTYNLPNTTLWKEGGNPEQAIKDIQTICKEVGATLERCFAVAFEIPAFGIVGKPYKR